MGSGSFAAKWSRPCPGAWDAICRKAMASRPADRYPSVAALAEDIEHRLGDEPVSAYAEPAGGCGGGCGSVRGG